MSDRPFAGMSAKEFAERYANRRIDVCPGATPYTARVVGYEPGGVLRVERDDGRADESTVPRSFARTAPGDAPWSTQTAYVRRVLDEPVSCVPPKGAAFTAENFVAAMVDASQPHAKAQPPCECRKYGDGWHGAACPRFAAECCRETSARSYVCTLLRGHTGEHVARTSAAYHAVVAANWSSMEKPAAPTEPTCACPPGRWHFDGCQPTKPKCGHRSVHGTVCDRAPHADGTHWVTHRSGRVTWEGAQSATAVDRAREYRAREKLERARGLERACVAEGRSLAATTEPVSECERCGSSWGYHPGITCPKCRRPSIRRLRADTARAERWERTCIAVGYDEELP